MSGSGQRSSWCLGSAGMHQSFRQGVSIGEGSVLLVSMASDVNYVQPQAHAAGGEGYLEGFF